MRKFKTYYFAMNENEILSDLYLDCLCFCACIHRNIEARHLNQMLPYNISSPQKPRRRAQIMHFQQDLKKKKSVCIWITYQFIIYAFYYDQYMHLCRLN